jgi:hypothetical protein
MRVRVNLLCCCAVNKLCIESCPCCKCECEFECDCNMRHQQEQQQEQKRMRVQAQVRSSKTLLFVANGNGSMKGAGQIDEVERGRRGGIGESYKWAKKVGRER